MRRWLLGLTATLLLGGCGSDDEGGSQITKEGSSEKTEESGPAGIGDPVALETFRTEIEATVEGVDESVKVGPYDKPSPGTEFVAVDMAIENIGSEPFGGPLINAVSLITDADQEASVATPAESQCPVEFILDIQVSPDDRRAGCIIFEVAKGQEARAFQFSVDGGGGVPSTGEWELR